MKEERSEFADRAKAECLTAVLVSVGDSDAAQEVVAEALKRWWPKPFHARGRRGAL